MSKITKWLLKNISSQKAKDFTCLIREGENIIKRIAEEAGNASYEITKDDGKVLMYPFHRHKFQHPCS